MIAAVMISGCSTHRATLSLESPYYSLSDLKNGEILHIPTGTFLTKEELLSYISELRVVYVGEIHDNIAHHRVQLEIITAMMEAHPGEVAVGMEMFRRPSQPILDQWVLGELDEKDFFKTWTKDWGGIEYDYYRDILDYIQKERIPLIALNTSKEAIDRVAHHNLKNIDEEEGVFIPDMDESDPYHKAIIEAISGDPRHKGENFDNFYKVQLLWEETMSQTIADYLRGSSSAMHMVVLAGGGHINYGFGIPKRVFRRLPVPYATIVLLASEVAGNKDLIHEKAIDTLKVELPEVPLYLADFAWSTDYETLEGKKPTLGVYLEEQEARVLIISVIHDSAADKGGLKDGDLIDAFDGEPILDSADLIYFIGLKKFGQEATLDISREGKNHKIKVFFEAPQNKE